MTAPVHILCTIRKPELIPGALLVFRTIRTGFPTAKIVVWGNGLVPAYTGLVDSACAAVGATLQMLKPTSHDAWIESLVINEAEPFWICDTDIVFFKEVERFFEDPKETLFAGRFEPSWKEPWTDTVKPERLHTCLQWFNPASLRGAILRWTRQRVPDLLATAEIPFIRQCIIPSRSGNTLYDTTAGLWQSGWGTPFTDEENSAFEHLHAGTYVDEAGKCEALKGLTIMHKAVYADPQLAAGLSVRQNEFYAANRA
jgi:hypothetical protein